MTDKYKFSLNGTYEYKGNKYLVQRILKIKCPVTRKWVDGVMYASHKADHFYARELNDFKNKFKLLE